MFDEWVKGCDEAINFKFINTLKKFSHHFSKFGHLIIIGFLGWFVSSEIEAEKLDSNTVVKFVAIYASVFYIVSSLADVCLKRLEDSIDGYLVISYLKINKGDNKLINNFKSRNKKSIILSLLGFMGAVGIGVFSSLSYDVIKYIIF